MTAELIATTTASTKRYPALAIGSDKILAPVASVASVAISSLFSITPALAEAAFIQSPHEALVAYAFADSSNVLPDIREGDILTVASVDYIIRSVAERRRDVFGSFLRLIIEEQKVAAATPGVLVFDLFTDTANTLLTNHTPAPTNTPGNSWSETVTSGNFVISNNKLTHSNASTSTQTAVINIGAANCAVACEMRHSGSGRGGLAIRHLNELNHWQVMVQNTGNFQLREVVAGVATNRASASVAVAAGQVFILAAMASGTTITATMDGSNSISYISATNFQTETRHGITKLNPGFTFDNFRAATG